jgi:phosphoribosylcarboxyaminoimidazole (NCAIR) mutase
MGARNAGHLAAEIIALEDADVEAALARARAAMREKVELPEGFTVDELPRRT